MGLVTLQNVIEKAKKKRPEQAALINLILYVFKKEWQNKVQVRTQQRLLLLKEKVRIKMSFLIVNLHSNTAMN